MTMSGARPGVLLAAMAAMAAVLVTGCGTERSGESAGAAAPSRTVATPSRPANFPCPGESRTPSPTRTAGASSDHDGPPADHDAENHGFRVPFELYGQHRCDGLAAVKRVKGALEPLRERGDFAPENVKAALTGLGYPAGKVSSYEYGPGSAGFLIEADESLCVEGRVSGDSTEANAFGGYPDHSGCEIPSGGH
ncbi:hypothetical protein AB0I22_05495 [Streptomyces sp. NPDC050610]|uniref:hypothetical protein n=1 Tax=Streptomyces sp. NPDC050610 TaxID=3157097 RepID=UPI0034215D2A